MTFKVGDKVVCFHNDNGSDQYIGLRGKIVTIGQTSTPSKYPYQTDFCSAGLGDHELEVYIPNKLKKGDRVRNRNLTSKSNGGKIGTVTNVSGEDYYYVKYDDGAEGQGEGVHYEKLAKKTFMKKVSVMMKKLLDSDTQILVKAGYINGDLDLTEAGIVALNAVLFDANKAALVVLAQADIDEAEKEKSK